MLEAPGYQGEAYIALEHPQMMRVEEDLSLEETDDENRYENVDGQVYLVAG